MRILVGALLLAATAFAVQQQAQPDPLIRENATVKVAEHVYVIPDFNVGAVPNVGIIVGSRATLVVDTGLGRKNGETVLREVNKVSKNTEVYVVSTHFHAEHALGESAFPAAKVIRVRAQQRDMDEFGITPNFAGRSPVAADLLKDAAYRKADEFFDTEKILDLGGVRVRLMWHGAATHTNGDTLIFIEGDGVLFAGDIIMNRRYLAFNAASSSVQAWINTIEKVAPLRPSRVVPSHGEMGDGALVQQNLTYLRDLQTRAAALKREGKTADEASQSITNELRAKYPNWTGNPTAAARSAYTEAK